MIQKIEQDFVNHENFMKVILDTLPVLVFVKDISGKYIMANTSMANAYGTTIEKMIGKTDLDFISKEVVEQKEVEKFINIDKKVILERKPFFIAEETITDITGNYRIFETIKIPLIINEKVKYVLGVSSDITDKKISEGVLRKSAEDLRKINEELESFAYIASHDLQEPLRVISSYAQLVKEMYKDKMDDEGHQYFNFIIEAACRMTWLIKELLNFAQVGLRETPYEKIDLNKLLENVKEDFKISIKECNVKIISQKLPVLMCEKVRIRQLLHNLISNAIKFRKRDVSPLIEIKVLEFPDKWRFSFKDNGIGIEPTHINKLFKLFKRLYTRDEYPGSGIGLATCKKIVENHGGGIWVESEKNKGATFFFTIPKGWDVIKDEI